MNIPTELQAIIGGAIGLVATVFATTTIVIKSINSTSDEVTKIKTLAEKWQERKEKKLAKKLSPYHQKHCVAFRGFGEIKETVNLMQRLLIYNAGDRIMQKANYHIEQKGYMPYEDKQYLIKHFLAYHLNGGNGQAFARVQLAINLPEKENGQACEMDLSEIIEMERK